MFITLLKNNNPLDNYIKRKQKIENMDIYKAMEFVRNEEEITTSSSKDNVVFLTIDKTVHEEEENSDEDGEENTEDNE